MSDTPRDFFEDDDIAPLPAELKTRARALAKWLQVFMKEEVGFAPFGNAQEVAEENEVPTIELVFDYRGANFTRMVIDVVHESAASVYVVREGGIDK